MLCAGLSLPAGAFTYDGDLPQFKLRLYLDSLPIMRGGSWQVGLAKLSPWPQTLGSTQVLALDSHQGQIFS